MHRLYLWHHRILYLGVSPENDLHSHHAAQICVSLDATLNIQVSGTGDMFKVSGVFISPDRPHRIDSGDACVLSLYLEPESTEYQTLIQPLRAGKPNGLKTLDLSSEGLSALRHLFMTGGDADDAWSTCVSALGLGSPAEPAGERDLRVEQVVGIIRSEPAHSHTVTQLASAVHLSPDRLMHLFRDQIGIPIRRFILWTRMREVVRLAVDGASLTDAAHASGFSDAAHMSNAFRRMFGFAPSALFSPRDSMDVHILVDPPFSSQTARK